MSYDLCLHVDANDPAVLAFAFVNVRNYMNGLPGKEFELVLVANGPAVKLFVPAQAELQKTAEELMARGLKLHLCKNALDANKMTAAALDVLLCRQSLGQMQEGLGRMVLEGSFAAAAQEVGLVAVQAPEEHDAPGRAALPRSWSRAASPAERPAAMPAAYGQTFRQERTFLFCLFFFPGARSVPDMPPAICNRRSASRISSLCRVNAPRMP